MKKTKFMEVMFSAVEDQNEALTDQVASDIEEAKQSGEVDTDEVTYINLGENKVLVIDNVNQEATIVEGSGEEYEMEAMPDEEIEKYLHTVEGQPENPDFQDGATEDVTDHLPEGTAASMEDNQLDSEELLQNEAGASDNKPTDGACPECGQDPCTCEGEDEEHTFSVSTNNGAVLKFFSDQMYFEKIMSDVIETGEDAKIGNIEVEKTDDDEVIITDLESGDQARVTIDGDELEVEELAFSALTDEEPEASEINQHEPMFVVGFNPDSHEIIDAPVYSEEDGNDLIAHLAEMGVVGLQIFENPDEAREYAHSFLNEEGAVEADEPEQAEFSERELYVTRYYSADEVGAEEVLYSDDEPATDFMQKVFSEIEETGESESKAAVEDAIESQEQIENGEVIITPVSEDTAVVEDKESGEYTKAVADEDGGLDMEAISEEEADELTKDIDVEKEFSETTYTRIMHKLFSEAEDDLPATEAKIVDAIENGDQIEDGEVIITPVNSETAIIEDKKNDELTKVTLSGENLDAKKISEEEADEYFKDIDVDEEGTDEDAEPETEEEKAEREFSERQEAYENMDPLERFFADATEEMVTVQVPASALQVAQPVAEAPAEAPAAEGADSVELIEDKAIAAVNSIQEAAQQAAELIQEAKQAPAPGSENDIQEAQFTDTDEGYQGAAKIFNDPMSAWLSQI
jgi:hypothetical protein